MDNQQTEITLQEKHGNRRKKQSWNPNVSKTHISWNILSKEEFKGKNSQNWTSYGYTLNPHAFKTYPQDMGKLFPPRSGSGIPILWIPNTNGLPNQVPIKILGKLACSSSVYLQSIKITRTNGSSIPWSKNSISHFNRVDLLAITGQSL